MLINPQLSLHKANQLTSTVQHLQANLQAIQPDNSQLTRTITFALIATALVGILVYHYIKQQEALS
jgi:outer membrane murein-binding lipoprotein Lpp